MFNELKMAYGVLIFYALLMMATATIGYKMDKQNGFTNGYIVGMVISLVLWFTVGKKYSNL
tara:strand:+ start:119 stop:301 length:183 start_codon:yes stop_codon:yes gene_type:complete